MQGYVLKIAYKGTNYCGWQVQPGKTTVQAVVQSACEAVFGCKVDVTGCSRTDSGVHAKGFVALVSGNGLPDIPVLSLPLAINTKLPEDISVLEASVAKDGFHPRYGAKGKEYVYTVHNSRLRDPFTADTAWQFQRRIDESIADMLCKEFVGRHDFTAFMASGGQQKTTVKTVNFLNVTTDENKIVIEINADGFLYNMVRIIAGTLVYAGVGKLDPKEIPDIIESGDRVRAGITAPPQGLCLKKVFY